MKQIIILLIIGICAIEANAKNITISGRVIEKENGDSLQYSTIQITNSKDSLVFAALIESKDGRFSFEKVNIEDDKYSIIFRFGYNLKKIIKIDGKNVSKHLNLGDVLLEEDIESLKGAKIVASGEVERLVGKDIFSIDSTLLKGVIQTSDILNKLPQIKAGPDGQSAKVIGKSNTLIMINGVNTGQSIDLRRVNYRDIEKVEVITMPSGDINQSYDAVINIVMKKVIRRGIETGFQEMLRAPSWDNDFYAGVGYGGEKAKVEFLYTNYFRNPKSILKTQRIDKLTGARYITDGEGIKERELDHTFNLNLDWNITKRDYFNITTQTELISADKRYQYNQLFTDINGDTTNILSPYNQRFAHNYFIGNYTLHYKHTMKNKDTDFISLTSNIGYSDNKDISNTIYETDGREVSSLEKGNRFSANLIVNYNNKINKTLTFTAGAQVYYRNQHSEVESEPNNPQNYYNYQYNIFSDLSADFDKWGFKVGLKGEGNSNIFHNANFKSNSQFSFQPHAGAVYRLDGKSSFRFDYYRRAFYPSAWYLVPYSIKQDDKTVWKGNPDLKQTMTNKFDLQYAYNGKKIRITTGPTYYHQINLQSTGYFYDTDLNLTKMIVNSGSLDRIGYVASVVYSPWEWLDIDPAVILIYDIYNTFEQRRETFSYQFLLDVSIYLPYDMMLYASASYKSRSAFSTGYTDPTYNISTVNFRKHFSKIGMTLTLSYWSPLYSPEIDHIIMNNYENINYSYRKNQSGVMFRIDFYFMSKKGIKRSNIKTYYDKDSRSD